MPYSNLPSWLEQQKTAGGVAAPAVGHFCNGFAQLGYQKTLDSASGSGAAQ
jgi:hypothetical protein